MLLLNIIIEEHNAIELLNGAREGFEHQPNFFHFSVETPNPKLSKSLLEKIIIELNNYVRQIELNESKLSSLLADCAENLENIEPKNTES